MRSLSHAIGVFVVVMPMAMGCDMTQAERLSVISDNGQGVPMGQYNNVLLSGLNKDEATLVQFPVQSTLKSGVLDKPVQAIDVRSVQWLTHPLALIGSDTRSKSWLKANVETLRLLGTEVLVVDVPDGNTFKTMVSLGQGLNMTPSHSERLAAQLKTAKAAVLPLYIDTKGRASQSIDIGDSAKRSEKRKGTP